MSELKPCPFCGGEAKRFSFSYSDNVALVGCCGKICNCSPIASVSVKAYPHDNTETTFWKDFDSAFVQAETLWNTRTTNEVRDE